MALRLRLVKRLLSTSRPPLPVFQRTAQQITEETRSNIDNANSILDKIAAVPRPTFSAVVKPYAALENQISTASNVLSYYQYVSADADIRQASEQSSDLMSAFDIERSRRPDVYKQIKAVHEAKEDLSDIDKRFLDKVLQEFRRNGLDLPQADQEKLTQLEKELSNVCIKYNANLGADNSFVMLSRQELEGVPDSVLDQFEVQGDKYKVTYKAPDYVPVMKYCSVPETRRKLYVGYENRVPENGVLITKALELRQQIAKLLGFDNFGEYILEDRMAGSTKAVRSFLQDLVHKARPLGEKEKQVFLELKKELEDPNATEVYAWDSAFYQNKVLERDFKVDEQAISQYFEMEHTISSMFHIFEELMGLKFVPVELAPENKWHDEITCFAIYQGEDFKGYLYLDMYPRENKYGHFANFGLYQGHIDDEGVHYPTSALVCNFPRASGGRPALLYHRDVVTFFHELGHGIHATLGLTKYCRFSGTNVARDFVETPSQLLENWTWDKAQLKQLSRHYKTGESLSDELLDALIRSKNANSATFLLRQLFFGLFDFEAHTTPHGFDLQDSWGSMRDSIIGLPSPDKLEGYNQFAHIMGGYECGYYGYLWSLVFAADIWKTKFAADPMDPAAGANYRDVILARGGSRDASDLLRELLGREPNNKAFLEEIGLKGE